MFNSLFKIGPGEFFVARGVRVQGYMGIEGDGRHQVILEIPNPITIIEPIRFTYPSRHLDTTWLNMMSIHSEGCKVNVTNMSLHTTNCSGYTCDLQHLFTPDGQARNRCVCRSMQRTSTLAVAVDLNIELPAPGGEIIRVMRFASRQFTNNYIVREELSPGTKLSRLDPHIESLWTSVSNVLNEINDKGGFSVSLWCKRGLIVDRSVVEEGAGFGRQQERVLIPAGDINYNLVSVLPTSPDEIDHNRIYGMKFDTSSLFLGESGS